jgi:hypothetical protein
VVHNVVVHNVTVTNGVNCCYDNVLNNSSFGELVNLGLVFEVIPVLPFVVLGEVDVIVNSSTIEK